MSLLLRGDTVTWAQRIEYGCEYGMKTCRMLISRRFISSKPVVYGDPDDIVTSQT